MNKVLKYIKNFQSVQKISVKLGDIIIYIAYWGNFVHGVISC